MRIAFVGKGGSGKTTLSSAFIRYCQKNLPKHLLAIDADVNKQLQAVLGMGGDPVLLGDRLNEVLGYLKGTREDLRQMPMIATTPPHKSSVFIRPRATDLFLQKYALQEGNLSLLTVGSYEEEDIGHTCYHGKLNVLEAFLHHLLDGEDDLVIADATAGVDMLGTSLVYAYDAQIFIVEPTNKSLQVYNDFIQKTASDPVPAFVIGNKIRSNEDEQFLRERIEEGRILGIIHESAHLRRFEQGERAEGEFFFQETEPVWKEICSWMRAQPARDWKRYLERLTRIHRATSREWYNEYYRAPIDTQADTTFQYTDVIDV